MFAFPSLHHRLSVSRSFSSYLTPSIRSGVSLSLFAVRFRLRKGGHAPLSSRLSLQPLSCIPSCYLRTCVRASLASRCVREARLADEIMLLSRSDGSKNRFPISRACISHRHMHACSLAADTLQQQQKQQHQHQEKRKGKRVRTSNKESCNCRELHECL